MLEPAIDNDDIDFDFYDDKVWPIIANRVPSFENSKVAKKIPILKSTASALIFYIDVDTSYYHSASLRLI